MAFAIFYNRRDLPLLAAELTRQDLPVDDAAVAAAAWAGGMNAWATAPQAPKDHRDNDADVRIIVIDALTVDLSAFREFYRRRSAEPGASYLQNYADDMGGATGAVEPWPV